MSIPAAMSALSLASQAISSVKKANKQMKKKNNNNRNSNNPPKAKNNKRTNQKATSSQLDQFTLALYDPFSPNAMGCRVPDPFPFPTTTYHLHQTTVLGTIGGGTTGSAIFFPNPCYSLADVSHAENVALTCVKSSAFTAFQTTSTEIGAGLYAATSQSALNAVFETWRIVSWGIKISNLQPQLSATGRIIIAIIPCGDTCPTVGELTRVGLTSGAITYCTGVATSSLNSSALLQLPSAMEFTVGDFLHGDIEVSGMYTNTNFWTFKSAVNNAGFFTGITSGDQVDFTTGSGLVNQASFKDATRMVGGCAIAVYFEGLPATTSNAFQVETIYHLEGTPTISSSANTTPVPSNAMKPFVGPLMQVEKSMAAVSRIDKAVKFIDRGASFLNENKSEIQNILTTIKRGAGY